MDITVTKFTQISTTGPRNAYCVLLTILTNIFKSRLDSSVIIIEFIPIVRSDMILGTDNVMLSIHQDVNCPEPLSPLNGLVNINGRSVGSVARYMCFTRYAISPLGDDTRTCTVFGWSGAEPRCCESIFQYYLNYAAIFKCSYCSTQKTLIPLNQYFV